MAERVLTPWKTLDRRMILDCGKFLKVEMHTVALPDGRVIDDWTWVVSPDFINVVAETVDGDSCVFGRPSTRSRAHRWRWWAAKRAGEAPLSAAKRKLWRRPATSAEWMGSAHIRSRPTGASRRGTSSSHAAPDGWLIPPPTTWRNRRSCPVLYAEMAHGLAEGEFKVLAWAANVALSFTGFGAVVAGRPGEQNRRKLT